MFFFLYLFLLTHWPVEFVIWRPFLEKNIIIQSKVVSPKKNLKLTRFNINR